jgi:hypothetical protein
VDAGPRWFVTGGSLGGDFLTFLGSAAVLGIPPDRVLRADPYELAVLVEAARHAAAYAQQRDLALAQLIINELGKAMKRVR